MLDYGISQHSILDPEMTFCCSKLEGRIEADQKQHQLEDPLYSPMQNFIQTQIESLSGLHMVHNLPPLPKKSSIKIAAKRYGSPSKAVKIDTGSLKKKWNDLKNPLKIKVERNRSATDSFQSSPDFEISPSTASTVTTAATATPSVSNFKEFFGSR